MPKKTRKRNNANLLEQALGVRGSTKAFDLFTNAAARMGFGTPSLGQGAEYTLVRLSYDYWNLVTLYRNHWVSRRIVDVPARDMVKAWPRLTSDIDPKDITRVDRALRRTNTKNNVQTALVWSRLFGGSGGLIVIDGHEDHLDEPLDIESVGLGAYKGVIPFDRWAGISPQGDVCTDVNRPLDFNKPETYEVRVSGGDSFKVHSSRILRFLGPTVPTPELEAQSYWGISVLEPVYESITKLDNMSWNILSLTFRANLMGMKFPELSQLLSGIGSSQKASQNFEQRMSAINHLMSNNSLIPLPTDGGLESTQYTFGGLAEVFQLFQLDTSGAAEIPVARLWGRTYSGLGQTGDGDERIYEEKIASEQTTGLVPQLEKLYPVICMSELGEVPDDLDLIFPSIRVLDEKEKAELAKSVADTCMVYLNGGVMSAQVVAREVKQSSDITGIGTNLTDEDIAKLPDTPQAEGELGEGLFGESGGGLNEADSPAKVIKEENREGKEKLDEEAGKPHSAAPAMDVAPAGLKPGEKLLVHGKLLTVKRVTTGTTDLFGEPTVQVLFDTGEIIAYRPNSDVETVKAKDADGASSITQRAGDVHLYHALPVRVETPQGGVRTGITDKGESWRIHMPADYGFIHGTKGADGDCLDCYIGPSPESNNVFVVDQYGLDGKRFDEHKVMLGYHTLDSAKEDYMLGHHKSSKTFAAITPFTVPMFRRWMHSHDMRKPCDSSVRI